MKKQIVTAILFSSFALSASAGLDSSRSRFSCEFLDESDYVLELAIDDIGDDTGTVQLINKSTQKAVRQDQAHYRDGIFSFGVGLTEEVWLESFESAVDGKAGPLDISGFFGKVSMAEQSGRIVCSEIKY